MHDLTNRLSEAQIVDIILLLEEQNLAQAQALLEAQLNISPEQALQILQKFAQQQEIALDASLKVSNLDRLPSIDLSASTNVHVKTTVAEHPRDTNKKKPNRVSIGLVILILVAILGFIFG